jgi:LacI family transcriptional regulator
VPVTISEIAWIARVSKSTVSRVINGSGPVSKKTKRVVLEAIDSADFQPSEIARSLTLKRTNTIGLVVQDIRNPLFACACWHVERFFRRFGYITIMCNADNEHSLDESVRAALGKRNVDGILCVGGEHGCSALARGTRVGAPAHRRRGIRPVGVACQWGIGPRRVMDLCIVMSKR